MWKKKWSYYDVPGAVIKLHRVGTHLKSRDGKCMKYYNASLHVTHSEV